MRRSIVTGGLRYLAIISGVAIGLLLLVELAGWLLFPDRYANPPAVTEEAWIHSDALPPGDASWLREYVAEFCLSYQARWTSYTYFRRRPFAGRLINVDSSGRRLTPQYATGPGGSDAPAVYLLGGSTMWGTGAPDSGTIPSLLSRALAARGVQRRVVNMGESGYVSTQALFSLQLELRKGNVPAEVIFYDGVNDVFSAYQNRGAGLPQNEEHRAVEFNLLLDNGRMIGLGWRSIWRKTVLAGALASLRGLVSPIPPAQAVPDGVAEEIVRIYRGNLTILDALSREYGFRYRAYWQPVVFSKRDPSPYERVEAERMGYIRPLILETYRRVAADSVLGANMNFRELSGIFDGAGPVYLDFCHITELGNAMVAERMRRDLFP